MLRSLASGAADPRLQASAPLALGVAAGKLASHGESARADLLVKEALQNLANATNDKKKVMALKSLGNSGLPAAFHAAEPLLSSPSPELRRQAANALRFVQDSLAAAALMKTIRTDSDASVRAAAPMALGYRSTTPALLNAQQEMFGNESSLVVREQLLRNISHARTILPDQALGFLRQVALQAKEKQLKDLAKQLLDGV